LEAGRKQKSREQKVIDAQRYPAQVFYSEEDEGFIAVATDLPGCSAFGDTQEEAVSQLRDAIGAWQMAAEKAGNPVPEPSKPHLDDLPSGKILLRLPRTLHAQLIDRAKYENVSLNQHLVFVLTAGTASTVASTSLRNAILDHQEMQWSRAVSVTKLLTFQNYVGDRGMILFDTSLASAMGQSWHRSSGKTYSISKLIDYAPSEEAAHG
jgi:predicted RNase H-like HicB family nuclease